jgi:hypothetical protein
MTWAKLDDGFFDNPKVMETSFAARGVWATALSWCARKLTDGKISAKAARLLEFPPELITELVVAGLWEPAADGNGWVLHDYLEYNPNREKVQALREAGKQRAAKHSSQRRTEPPAMCAASREASDTACEENALLTGVPDPDPDPDPGSQFPDPPHRGAREGDGLIEVRGIESASPAIGYRWLDETLGGGGRAPDMHAWRREYALIAEKPAAERALVAKHMMASDYIIEKPAKAKPDHILRFWSDFVAGPRNLLGAYCRPGLTKLRKAGPAPVATDDEYAQAKAIGGSTWDF